VFIAHGVVSSFYLARYYNAGILGPLNPQAGSRERNHARWSRLPGVDRPALVPVDRDDLNTGQIIWQVPNGGVAALGDGGKNTGSMAPRSGVVVTGGGLVFAGTASERKFRAYDQDTGKVIWEFSLPTQIASSGQSVQCRAHSRRGARIIWTAPRASSPRNSQTVFPDFRDVSYPPDAE
jgi:hypothetical protein